MGIQYHTIQIAGIECRVVFRFPETVQFFGSYIQGTSEDGLNAISVKDYEFEDWKNLGNEVNPHGEYSLLSLQTSEALFEHQRFIFHAVAFRWNDRAWLLTGQPGVGKSTQYKNLKELYPEEISIINGDRPVLQILDDGGIMVHPSPWNGKENWCGAEAAPLAGIIYLKQGKENTIRTLTAQEAAVRTLSSVFHSYENEDVVKKAAKMASTLLKHTPLWLLTNKGDLESSALLLDTLKDCEKQKNNV